MSLCEDLKREREKKKAIWKLVVRLETQKGLVLFSWAASEVLGGYFSCKVFLRSVESKLCSPEHQSQKEAHIKLVCENQQGFRPSWREESLLETEATS